jgi:hypothetical protein
MKYNFPKQEVLEKLNAFLDSLPQELKGKCSLCTKTLTHVVKMAEAQTGAAMSTVTRVLADQLNEGAAPEDVVNPSALRARVRYMEGTDRKPVENRQVQDDKKQQAPETEQVISEANYFATLAISHISRIERDDPLRDEAYDRILNFIAKERAK